MPRTVERTTHRLYTDQRRRQLWTKVPRRDDLDDDLDDRATSPRSDRKWQRAAAAEASATGNET